ncbi:MAG: 50S ribosomal protein L9 [Chloroflexota bacterium]|nr:50S ribosomal protein L9 [Chloroflexota bacterium]
MEVVLLKDVSRLGEMGDIRDVAPGYARNYLIPRGLATPATEAAHKRVQERVAAEARRDAAQKESAEAKAADLKGVELLFTPRVGESGRLYGSITKRDIVEQILEKTGEEIETGQILLDDPLKEVGEYQVEVKLHSDVTQEVKITVKAREDA